MRRFAPQPAPGPYPFSLIARRAVLGGMVLAGLFLVIGTELRHALTGEPHSLSLLAFGVSLILLPVVTAAISALLKQSPKGRRP